MRGKSSEVLTIDDMSVYLNVSKSTLYKRVRKGKVPSQKVGRHWRFHKDAVDAWLNNNSQDRQARQP